MLNPTPPFSPLYHFPHLLVPLLPLITFTILYYIFFKRQPPYNNNINLPPGPKPLPILGNLLHVTKNPLSSLAHLSKFHGPLISLKLGTQILVVGSSPEAAKEILKTHDRVFSARGLPRGSVHEPQFYETNAIVWASGATQEWKCLRGMVRNGLFSSKAIRSQCSLREKKVWEMVRCLEAREGFCVNIGEVVFVTVFNILSNLIFSEDFISVGGDGGELKRLIGTALELGAAPNIVDFYPVLERFDPQGIRKRITRLVKEICSFWEVHISERRRERDVNGFGGDGDCSPRDLLDVFLANGFHDEQINWLVFVSE